MMNSKSRGMQVLPHTTLYQCFFVVQVVICCTVSYEVSRFSHKLLCINVSVLYR